MALSAALGRWRAQCRLRGAACRLGVVTLRRRRGGCFEELVAKNREAGSYPVAASPSSAIPASSSEWPPCANP